MKLNKFQHTRINIIIYLFLNILYLVLIKSKNNSLIQLMKDPFFLKPYVITSLKFFSLYFVIGLIFDFVIQNLENKKVFKIKKTLQVLFFSITVISSVLIMLMLLIIANLEFT